MDDGHRRDPAPRRRWGLGALLSGAGAGAARAAAALTARFADHGDRRRPTSAAPVHLPDAALSRLAFGTREARDRRGR